MIRPTVLLKSNVAKYAIYGGLIALAAILMATLLASYISLGNISLENIMRIQSSNIALWVLDVMPFVFMYWGQHTGSQIVAEADTMIVEKSSALWQETEALREKIKQESLSDSLTQLANAHQCLQHLDKLIQGNTHHKNTRSLIQTLSGFITREHHTPSGIALILLDIDNFREINNTLGSQNGDLMLKHIALRLNTAFARHEIFLARVGGDDFALVLHQTNEAQTIEVVEKIQHIFKLPFDIQGVALLLEYSIGISMYPSHGNHAKELLQHAEIAMYVCKKEAQAYVFYYPGQNAHNLNDLILKNEISLAFAQNEFYLLYQPKLDRQNNVREVEALVRWNHPVQGLIGPDIFIPMIVQKRMHGESLQRILDLALSQAKAWQQADIHLRIALNLTSFDLLEEHLPDMVAAKLAAYDLIHDSLKFEITESSLIENQKLTLKTLNKFKHLGIPTSIDDFGTGYSSLSYLSSLPISEVKIDMSFVKTMNMNPKNAKIIQAIIALAHSLSLQTVAEGVEDAATMKHLRQLGCDFIQGYYICKPLPGDQLTLWLQAMHKKKNNPILIPAVDRYTLPCPPIAFALKHS